MQELPGTDANEWIEKRKAELAASSSVEVINANLSKIVSKAIFQTLEGVTAALELLNKASASVTDTTLLTAINGKRSDLEARKRTLEATLAESTAPVEFDLNGKRYRIA